MILERNITADTYRQPLETEMIPCARRHFGRNFLFQHDNASADESVACRISCKMKKLSS